MGYPNADEFNEWFNFLFDAKRHAKAKAAPRTREQLLADQKIEADWASDKQRLCAFLTHTFKDAGSLLTRIDDRDAEAGLWHIIGAGRTLQYVLRGSTPYGVNEPPLPSWEARRDCIRSTYYLFSDYLGGHGLTVDGMWWEEFPKPYPNALSIKEGESLPPESQAYYGEVLDVLERLLKHPDRKLAKLAFQGLAFCQEPSGRAKNLEIRYKTINE